MCWDCRPEGLRGPQQGRERAGQASRENRNPGGERGAGKTLSCGSGILAASYASFINKKCSDSIKISLPIGSVKVNIKENALEIIGVAEVSYLGEYNFA